MFIIEKFYFPSSKFTDYGRKLYQFPSIISEFWVWKLKFLNDKHFIFFQIFFDARVLAYTLISAVLESAIGLSISWIPKKPSKSSITTSFLERDSYNENWKNLRLPRQSQWSLVLIFRWGKNRISILEKSIICIPLAYIFGMWTRKKHNFLLPWTFSLLSTQQKCAWNKRNKTSRFSASFSTKNHQNPLSSLGERVVWNCMGGFKNIPKLKTRVLLMYKCK